MILYFEKTLCNIAQDIRFALFFFMLFNNLLYLQSLFDTIDISVIVT